MILPNSGVAKKNWWLLYTANFITNIGTDKKNLSVKMLFRLNIYFVFSKEPSPRDGSSEHPNYMVWSSNKNKTLSITHFYLEA